MLQCLKRQSPARIIALGFLLAIMTGSGLLMLPCCLRNGQSIRYIDALYMSASAVCVTGLVTIDPGTAFSSFGLSVIAVLMQLGGLGVSTVGAFFVMAMGRHVQLKGRAVIRESMNLRSGKGVLRMMRCIFLTTIALEAVGAILCVPVFARDYPMDRAIGMSVFHAIASFCNAGFDILGSGASLAPYRQDAPFILITCALIVCGGVGFPVLRECAAWRFSWRKLSLNSKAALTMTAILIPLGAVLLLLTERIDALNALLFSVSARTAGFSTMPLRDFTSSGLLVLMGLMFIGACPGSTGGGIRTTTFLALLLGLKGAAGQRRADFFGYSLASSAFQKAALIALVGIGLIFTSAFLLLTLEPDITMGDALFEMTSAFTTAGMSTGITASLGDASKLMSILMMFLGRLGPLTVLSFKRAASDAHVRRPAGDLAIG